MELEGLGVTSGVVSFRGSFDCENVDDEETDCDIPGFSARLSC